MSKRVLSYGINRILVMIVLMNSSAAFAQPLKISLDKSFNNWTEKKYLKHKFRHLDGKATFYYSHNQRLKIKYNERKVNIEYKISWL